MELVLVLPVIITVFSIVGSFLFYEYLSVGLYSATLDASNYSSQFSSDFDPLKNAKKIGFNGSLENKLNALLYQDLRSDLVFKSLDRSRLATNVVVYDDVLDMQRTCSNPRSDCLTRRTGKNGKLAIFTVNYRFRPLLEFGINIRLPDIHYSILSVVRHNESM